MSSPLRNIMAKEFPFENIDKKKGCILFFWISVYKNIVCTLSNFFERHRNVLKPIQPANFLSVVCNVCNARAPPWLKPPVKNCNDL